ncbi:peptide MFS transporter [Enteractinococcus helveticum]|uniref:Major facilitator superfamily (MFS) profile domain-containing protein n=1 Tax=Enteractinococcus helveticum TaxID=1837282 RepID=A0A1B7M239_9MICC|nr:oligopeptide:H+ symporter [Enteractinococcus helveticum]OAV62609.1 hypothetical protein A6F49_05445 [Enteractinococcus helveticum]
MQYVKQESAPERRRVAGPRVRAFGHPLGLFIVSGAELWERFSFYAIQGILLYFIYYGVADGGLGLDQAVALAVVGSYGGVVYLIQPFGAWLADRLIAVRSVILLGAVIIMFGHIALSFAVDLSTLVVGLGLIAIGTGLLMPNALAVVGQMYKGDRAKQDSGYSLYYGAILIGALAGPVIAGLLQTRVSFQAAFLSAAVGMAFGIIVYLLGWKHLPTAAREVPYPIDKRSRNQVVILGAGALGVVFLAVFLFVDMSNVNAFIVLITVIAAALLFLNILRSSGTTHAEKRRVVMYVPVFIACVIFWALILQLFTTFAIYADQRVNMSIGGFEVPPAFISTFEVIAGILFTIPMAAFWQRLRARQPSTPVKIGIGAAVMTVAFLGFAGLSYMTSDLLSIYPVIIMMIIFGLSEVICAPLFFSMAEQAAPEKLKSQMMALSGLALGIGASLSGFIGSWYVNSSSESAFFLGCAGLAIAMGALVLVFLPLFKKMGLDITK